MVEDNAPLREALAKRLRSDGFAVDEAGDGKEGLWLAIENPYSLIVLDLTLPGMDGIELLQKIRQSKKNVSVLITTARDSIPERIVGLDAGADDYMIKPFALDEFMARVRAQVRRVNDKSETILKISDLDAESLNWSSLTLVAKYLPSTRSPRFLTVVIATGSPYPSSNSTNISGL